MFKIENGGMRFYQWDTNRRLIVEDSKIKQVHFCNTTEDCSLVVDVYTENGVRLADVPNVLLQETWPIRVYAYESYTKHYAVFNIVARTKPADYVYTETEIKSWEALEKRMDEIEGAVTIEGVKTAVEEYLAENPVSVDMSAFYTKNQTKDYVDSRLANVENLKGTVDQHGSSINSLSVRQEQMAQTISGMGEAVEEVNGNMNLLLEGLAEEFEMVREEIEQIELTPGPQGKPGKDGAPGKDAYDYALDGGYEGTISDFARDINPSYIIKKATPVKDVDYFDGKDGKDYVLTETDKKDIAAQVGTTETWTFTLASGEKIAKEVLIK